MPNPHPSHPQGRGRVHGKIALVTGASRGIGAETARVLAQEGAHVILADIAQESGHALAQEMSGFFHFLDVSSPHHWKKLTSDLKKKVWRYRYSF